MISQAQVLYNDVKQGCVVSQDPNHCVYPGTSLQVENWTVTSANG